MHPSPNPRCGSARCPRCPRLSPVIRESADIPARAGTTSFLLGLENRRHANGAPGLGRRRRMQDSLATMRAISIVGQTLWPGLTRLPRLVARGYPAAVLRTFSRSVSTFLRRKRCSIQALRRDQFVILIGGPFTCHLPLGRAGRARAGPPSPGPAAGSPAAHRLAVRRPTAHLAARRRRNIRSCQTIRRNICSGRTHICCNSFTRVAAPPLRVSVTPRPRTGFTVDGAGQPPQGRTANGDPPRSPPRRGGSSYFRLSA